MTAKLQRHLVAFAITEGIRTLESSNIGDARRNVEWMLCELLNCNRASLYGYPEREVPADQWPVFLDMIERRSRREPLQYILGYTSFYGHRIEVSPAVLIPRPETEQLFEKARSFLADARPTAILDLCTGSGCLPVAFHYEYPQSTIYACDVSPEALDVARKNAGQHQADIVFFQCDLLENDISTFDGQRFDVIVSNPPYIPAAEFAGLDPEVNRYEPELALNAGGDPLVFYRAISKKAGSWLLPGGALLFETHCDFAFDVRDSMRDVGFVDLTVDLDLAGRPRIVSGVWDGR